MVHISALDIEQWSDRLTAGGDLPRLLSKLIWTSAKGLTRLDMPGGELTRLSGFDGLVECANGDDLIPQGLSAWELSVEKVPGVKAESDYVKRTGNPLEVMMADTTYVCVTSRRWPLGEAWAERKRLTQVWGDVRVLRSQDLEKWLSRVPWIASAVGPLINNRIVDGIESLDSIWTDYSSVALKGANELSGEFVISDRVTLGISFLHWLESDVPEEERIIYISGPSRREVLHYVSATIRALSESDRDRFESRMFIVDSKAVARTLGGLQQHHVVLVPAGDATPFVLDARKRAGCRVVILQPDAGPIEPMAPGRGPRRLTLEPMSRAALVTSVARLGFSAEEAARLCADCGFDYQRVRSATVFY